jgi:hypothetical protein
MKVYGSFTEVEPGNAPPGFYVPIIFDQLLLTDQRTRDGRNIHKEGFAPFDLPRSIKAQFKSTFGHDMADIAGRLDEVTVHDDGTVSGRGWALNDENGRRAAFLIKTEAFRGNSVDLSVKDKDVEINVTEDEDGFLSFEMDFKNARLAATTLVAEPAFENAGARIPDGWTVEGAEPLADAITAAVGEPKPEHAYAFSIVKDRPKAKSENFRTEAWLTELTPLFVDSDDAVFGHIASWKHEHQNLGIIAPRSRTNYAYFANRSVETEDGFVATGPLVIDGNHAEVDLGWKDAVDHYANTCAAWADVCIGEDEFGIWVSGQVRPGTKAETVYAGRASGISGDWRWVGAGHELIAALSVNTPAFPTPRAFGHSKDHHLTILSAGFIKPRAQTLLTAETDPNVAFVAKQMARARLEQLAAKHSA